MLVKDQPWINNKTREFLLRHNYLIIRFHTYVNLFFNNFRLEEELEHRNWDISGAFDSKFWLTSQVCKCVSVIFFTYSFVYISGGFSSI